MLLFEKEAHSLRVGPRTPKPLGGRQVRRFDHRSSGGWGGTTMDSSLQVMGDVFDTCIQSEGVVMVAVDPYRVGQTDMTLGLAWLGDHSDVSIANIAEVQGLSDVYFPLFRSPYQPRRSANTCYAMSAFLPTQEQQTHPLGQTQLAIETTTGYI